MTHTPEHGAACIILKTDAGQWTKFVITAYSRDIQLRENRMPFVVSFDGKRLAETFSYQAAKRIADDCLSNPDWTIANA